MKRLIGMLFTLLVAGWTTAHAHTSLRDSAPSDGAQLTQVPEEIVLVFSEPVRLTALAVEQRGGERHRLGPLPRERIARFTFPAPQLTSGEYVVTWRVVSADTHVVSGDIAFSVADADAADLGGH
jgi:copper transport protein